MSIRATAQYTITDLNDATEIVKDFYGESSILNKSGNSNFKEFNLLGNSKQKITSLGNNLLDSSFGSFSMNGITATYNNDTQELTINGTCTKNNTGLSFSHFTKVNLKTNEKLYAKVKYVSGSCTGGASFGFGIFNSDWTKNVVVLLNEITGDLTRVFTADSDISISRAQIRFDKGDICNNLKITLMETKRNIAYTNFIPNSPSIDYPSENKSVGDNKNLIIETSDNLWYNTDTNLLITSSNVVSVIAKVPKNCDITISKKNGSNRFAVLTCTNKPASGVTFKQIFIDNENLNRKTYTFKNTDGEYLWIGLCNSTVNEDKRKALEEVKVETGTTVTPYSPFGSGNININVYNKNLVDYRKLSLWKRTTGWNMSSMQISDGIIKINNTKAWDVFSIYDKRFINKKISITGEIRYTKKSDNFWGVIVTTNKYSDYPKINPSLNTWTEFSHTITSNGYIGFCIRGKDDDTVNTQIEIRNIAISFDNPIEYIPHEEQNYTIDTQEPFRVINNVRDCFVLKEDGKWYERHKIKRYEFTGNEKFNKSGIQTNISYYYNINSDSNFKLNDIDTSTISQDSIDTNTTIPMIKCNYLKTESINKLFNNTMCITSNLVTDNKNVIELRMGFGLNTEITTTASLTTWLKDKYEANTPIYVDYILAKPIDIECTPRQQEQLDILTKNSYTYEDTTILNSIDEIPPILSGKYYTYYKGNLSVGVRTVRVDYQVSSNGVDIPSGTWESQIPSTQPNQFLWTRTTTYFTDNTTKTSYSISRNGTNGTTARTYWLSSSTTTINRSMSKVLKPSTITFNSYYRDGTSATNTSYAGRFIIQESSDGKSWTTKYTSSANESSKTYTPTSTTSVVKCTMYVAGGTTTALDTTTVNIVDSIDDLQIGGNNLFPNGGLSKGNNTSMEYNKDTYTYTITAPVVTNTFGAGVNLNYKVLLPFGKDYRVSCEVYCDTLHRLIVDHNNAPASGGAWSGNDNDYGPERVGVTPSTIPANTWTKIYWGGSNRNSNNINKVDLLIYDHLGIITKDDTQSITWKIRKIQVEIGNVVTEWTPYLEDMDKRIDDAKNSADTANNKFDNLQIGGKNYLKGTRDLSGANVKRTIESEKYLDFTVTSYTTSETSGYMDVLKWDNALEIKPNTEYCLSFYAKGKGTLESFLYPDAVESGTNSDNYNIISSDGRSFLTLTETWKRYWIKWKTKDTAEGLKGVIVGRLTNTATSGNQSVYLCGPMLEESNTPSDWSPAPEDIDNRIDNISIGGRNLLVGTSSNKSYYINDTSGWAVFDPYRTYNKTTLKNLGLKSGDEVTISFNWSISQNGNLGFVYGNFRLEWLGINSSGVDNQYLGEIKYPVATFSSTNTSGKAIITTTLNDTFLNAHTVRVRIDKSVLVLKLSKMKLEKGNKATDWTPAPEDVDNKIDNIQVGGRNLVLGTSNEWSDWISLGEGTNMCKVLGTVDLAKLGLKYGDSLAIQITFEGADYTSLTRFYTQGTVNKSWSGDNWFPNPWNSKLINVTSIDVMNKINKYTYIYDFPNSSINKINSVGGLIELGVRQDGANAEAKFRWKELKVEIGNKQTDWSPAPEDTDNKIFKRPTVEETIRLIGTQIDASEDKIDGIITGRVNNGVSEAKKYTDQEIKIQNITISKEIDKSGNKIRDLEYFASTMDLKGNEFAVGIEKTKGINLLKNSVMKQHKNAVNSSNIKANFWLNNSLKEDYLPNVIYGEDANSRANTSCGNFFSFKFDLTNNTKLDYIFSDKIDFKKNASNVFLSYKIKHTEKLNNGNFFIGLVFYKEDISDSGMGIVSSGTGIQNAYYIPVVEYTDNTLGKYDTDYVYKTLPITRQGKTTVEEILDVHTIVEKETIDNKVVEKVVEKYVDLTYTPSATDSDLSVFDFNNNILSIKNVSGTKIVLEDLTLQNNLVTIRYNRDLQNFIAMDSPNDLKIKTALSKLPVSEVNIYYNSSNKKIWTYNPFIGKFIETSNLYDTNAEDTNIDAVRVIIGARSNSDTVMTGQIDISDLKLEYDSVSTIWTQNAGETYSKKYKMDEKGFSISSDTNTMFIDEDEIAAYEIDDDGKLKEEDPVFQIKKEKTILRKTIINNQLLIENDTPLENDAFVFQQQNINNKWYFICY